MIKDTIFLRHIEKDTHVINCCISIHLLISLFSKSDSNALIMMHSDRADPDGHVEKSTELILDVPTVTVPQAMRVHKFSDQEAGNKSLQIQLHHLVKRMKTDYMILPSQFFAFLKKRSSLNAERESKTSTITTHESIDESQLHASHSSPLAMKQIRKTSIQYQEHHVNEKMLGITTKLLSSVK